MKKAIIILLSLFLVFQSFALIIASSPASAEATPLSDEKPKTVKVVYYRFDQNYEGWNLWVWPKAGDGKAYSFTSDTPLQAAPGKIAKVAEIDVSAFETKEAGIIVRKGEWEAKDIETDRFFPLTKADQEGVLTLYLVQNVEKIAFSENDAPLSPKIEKAEFRDSSNIQVDLQAASPSLGGLEGFTVKESGRDIKLEKVTRGPDGMKYIIKLSKEANPAMNYTVSKEGFGEAFVSSSKLFDAPYFTEQFTYTGDDLGVVYTTNSSTFRLWAPTAEKVVLKLYSKGQGGSPDQTLEMLKDQKGTWLIKVDGDLKGTYYTYEVKVGGQAHETVDPYAVAAGVNGDRAMVIDLTKTNPEGWDKLGYKNLESPTDAVIYEMHIRDTSIDPSSGVQNAGKYLSFTEKDTKTKAGSSTGLAHVKELGITHVHLLPAFDFNSIDESKLDQPQFNWGYDPKNYNVPDGSYSTDPFDGAVRVKEFKQMVKAFKEEGIGVIMDVVYNHTALSADSDFNRIVPDYYYRLTPNGKFSNGSACGNEIASERAMVRKYIVDSVVYWAKEYKIDGFRFDLMGLIDIQTMNEVRQALNQIDTSIIVYGEGWRGGSSTLIDAQSALKENISKIEGVAVFNDNTRDGIKGHVFESESPGFVGGKFDLAESIKFGIVGGISHPGVQYNEVNYDKSAWASSPAQCVNYIAAHDNLSLYDKFFVSTPGLRDADYKAMTRLSGAMFLTSQGIPFMLSGTDFMRSKEGNENSYNAPDSVNSIKWDLKDTNRDVFDYYKGLIALRKAHPAFRMATAEEVVDNLTFIEASKESIIAYTLNNNARNDLWKTIVVAFNAGSEEETLTVPVNTTWNVVVNGEKAGTETLTVVEGDIIKLAPMSALVAYDARTAKSASIEAKHGLNLPLLIGAGAALLVATGFVTYALIKRRKK